MIESPTFNRLSNKMSLISIKSELSRFWLAYALLVPALLLVGLMILYPMGKAILLSFYDINWMSPEAGDPYVGIGNYLTAIHRPDFWAALGKTFLFTTIAVAGTYISGLLVALILNMGFRGRNLARTLLLIPWAVPPAVAATIWGWILDAEFGVLNYMLMGTSIISQPIQWLVHPVSAFASVLIVQIWKMFPVSAAMLLAALQTIPHQRYEAAMIDGTNAFRKFRYITFPGLRSVNGMVFLFLCLGTFRSFSYIFILTEGGPSRATETLPIQTYLRAFQTYRMGYAATLGVATLLISLVFTIFYLKYLKSID